MHGNFGNWDRDLKPFVLDRNTKVELPPEYCSVNNSFSDDSTVVTHFPYKLLGLNPPAFSSGLFFSFCLQDSLKL